MVQGPNINGRTAFGAAQNDAATIMTDLGDDLLSYAAQDSSRLADALTNHVDPDKIRDSMGRGLLHHAAGAGNAKSVQFLLAKGLSPNVRDTHCRHTPLHSAVSSDSFACVERLLDAGADPNLSNERSETPIFEARSLEVLTGLVKAGANFDLRNSNGQTLLRYTVLRVVSPEVLKFWLEHGLSVEDVDNQHRTAIHGIFEFGFDDVRITHADRMECLQQLIAAEANINHADAIGRTPLHHAAWHSYNRTDFLDRLLAAGAQPNPADKSGTTPLMFAASKDLLPVIERLLAQGADPNLFDAYHQYAVDLCSRRSQARQRLQQVTEKIPKPAVRMSDIVKRVLAIPQYARQVAHHESAGCTAEELSVLESAIGKPLPASYRLFLSKLGHGLDDFLTCDHMTFQYEFVLETARDNSASFREYADLPTDAVIIMTRMGDWTAFYRSNGRSKDPAVYAVEPCGEDEIAKPKRVARSISDLFDDLVREHEQWFGDGQKER